MLYEVITLAATLDDGANEREAYVDATSYVSVNEPMIVGIPGTTMKDPNRWQPLLLGVSITQNGIVLPSGLQSFIGVNAKLTTPFAMVKPTYDTIAPDPRITSYNVCYTKLLRSSHKPLILKSASRTSTWNQKSHTILATVFHYWLHSWEHVCLLMEDYANEKQSHAFKTDHSCLRIYSWKNNKFCAADRMQSPRRFFQ